jgi:hypothetical protein
VLPDEVENDGERYGYSKRGTYLFENEGNIVVLFDNRSHGGDAAGRRAEEDTLRKRLKEAGVEEIRYASKSRQDEEGGLIFDLVLQTNGGGVDLVKAIVIEVLTGGSPTGGERT